MVLEKSHECWLCDCYVAKQTKGDRLIHWCCWHDKETNPNGLCPMYIRYKRREEI